MKIAITGSSGVIGRALVDRLTTDGHEVIRLVRRTPRTADEHRWDPQHRRIDPAVLRDVDAVINLAGASFAPRPWTPAYEQRLLSSRVDSTLTISDALATAAESDPGRPRALLSGSGVSFYGDTGDRPIDEDAPPGTGFMAELPARWEAATSSAQAAGVRVVHLRTGLVIARGAPLLKVLGLVFRLGLGGRIGSGRQYWPWISLADEVGAHPAPAHRRRLGTGQPDRAGTGDQRRVHPGPRRTSSAVPRCSPCPRSRSTSHSRVRPLQRGRWAAGPARPACSKSGYRFAETDLAEALRVALERR